jgi:hypothetical protein
MARFRIYKRKYVFKPNMSRWIVLCLICNKCTVWITYSNTITYIYQHDLLEHGMRPNATQEEDSTRKGRS